MEMQSIQEVMPSQLNPKITELSAKAKEAEKSAVNLMEPGQKPRRGRPPGSKAKSSVGQTVTSPTQSAGVSSANHSEATSSTISSARIAEPFVKLVSKAGAGYVGDKRAEMTAQELNDVAESLGMVMDKWMPVISKDFGAEFLLVSAFTAYGVRIMAMKKVLDDEKKQLKEFEKQIQKDDPEKPIASQLAITPDLRPQNGLYMSPTIGI